MKVHSFHAEVTSGDELAEVEVFFTRTPDVPATFWQPAEGGEVEIQTVMFEGDDVSAKISEADMERLEGMAAEADIEEDDGPEPDDVRDDRAAGWWED